VRQRSKGRKCTLVRVPTAIRRLSVPVLWSCRGAADKITRPELSVRERWHVREEIAFRTIRVLGLLLGGLAHRHFLLQIPRARFDNSNEVALSIACPAGLQLKGRERRQDAPCERKAEKPGGLVEVRQQPERDGRARLVSDAVAVGGDHLEGIARGWKMSVVRGTSRTDVQPVSVEPLQPHSR
jgi:hypothetical protein